MEVLTSFSLKKYNSFKIDAIAENFVSVKSLDELVEVLKLKKYPSKYILSGGIYFPSYCCSKNSCL